MIPFSILYIPNSSPPIPVDRMARSFRVAELGHETVQRTFERFRSRREVPGRFHASFPIPLLSTLIGRSHWVLPVHCVCNNHLIWRLTGPPKI